MVKMGNAIHMRAIQRGCEVAGSQGSLASFLEVSPLLVSSWIHGTSEVPAGIFLKVVDLVLEHATLRGAIPASELQAFKHREAANS